MVADISCQVIKRNVIANMLGSSWTIALQLVIVPFQVKILGVEAFGLLAFLASVQILFSVFDLGLSPTITREVASDQSPDLRHSRELVQSLTLVYVGIAVLLGGALSISAPWLATNWLKLDGLSKDSATLAIQLGALAIMLRWPVSFCVGIIAGRQRFDLLNLLTAGMMTVGLLGGIVVILLSSSLIALLVWRVVFALAEVTVYIAACFRLLPGLTLRPRFAGEIASQIWPFAGSMGLLAIQTLLLSQADRFLISRLLPITALGYYALGSNVAMSLAAIQGTVSSVMFPTLTTSYVRGEREAMVVQCAKAVQAINFCVAFPAFVLVFFGYDVLRLWIDFETAQASYQVLGILAVSVLLNAPLNVLSTLAFTTGHTRSLLIINTLGICLYIPCLYLLTSRFSLQGAALAFVLLQIYNLIVLPPLALRILGESGAFKWMRRNMLPFVLIGGAIAGLAKVAVLVTGSGVAITILVCGLSAVVYLTFASLALQVELRRAGQRLVAQVYFMFLRLLGWPRQSGVGQ